MSTAMAKDINYFGKNYLPLNVRIVTPEYLLKQYSEEKEAGAIFTDVKNIRQKCTYVIECVGSIV